MKTTILTVYVLATFALLNATVCASELSDAINADYGRLDALGFAVTRNINETGLVGTMTLAAMELLGDP